MSYIYLYHQKQVFVWNCIAYEYAIDVDSQVIQLY